MAEHPLKEGGAVELAARLFAGKAASLGKAAKLARLSVEEFTVRLDAMGIPAVDYPPEELIDELAAFALAVRGSFPAPGSMI